MQHTGNPPQRNFNKFNFHVSSGVATTFAYYMIRWTMKARFFYARRMFSRKNVGIATGIASNLSHFYLKIDTQGYSLNCYSHRNTLSWEYLTIGVRTRRPCSQKCLQLRYFCSDNHMSNYSESRRQEWTTWPFRIESEHILPGTNAIFLFILLPSLTAFCCT